MNIHFKLFILFCISLIFCTESIVINEINYNSQEAIFNPEDWVEFYNTTSSPINMYNWKFYDENESHVYTFDESVVIDANGYIVLCKNIELFTSLFPNVINCFGDIGFGFAGGGESLRLVDYNGSLIDSVHYDDNEPWPIEADGEGSTLELINPYYDNLIPSSWGPSNDFGTPGSQNSNYIPINQDCNGEWGGNAILDQCEVCVSPDDSSSCIQGCDGNYANDGTHLLDDECGVCGGDNSTCSDCAGTPNGTSTIDECGACVSSDDTSCIQGCDGNYANDGTHLEEDVCGVCNGGINDVSSCVDCPESDPADCFGVCGGSAVNDECGVCSGDNSTCSDCTGTPNGTSIIDECGACVSSDDISAYTRL